MKLQSDSAHSHKHAELPNAYDALTSYKTRHIKRYRRYEQKYKELVFTSKGNAGPTADLAKMTSFPRINRSALESFNVSNQSAYYNGSPLYEDFDICSYNITAMFLDLPPEYDEYSLKAELKR